jgi:hypothetical protein
MHGFLCTYSRKKVQQLYAAYLINCIVEAKVWQFSQNFGVASYAGLVHPSKVELGLVQVRHFERIQVHAAAEDTLPGMILCRREVFKSFNMCTYVKKCLAPVVYIGAKICLAYF